MFWKYCKFPVVYNYEIPIKTFNSNCTVMAENHPDFNYIQSTTLDDNTFHERVIHIMQYWFSIRQYIPGTRAASAVVLTSSGTSVIVDPRYPTGEHIIALLIFMNGSNRLHNRSNVDQCKVGGHQTNL